VNANQSSSNAYWMRSEFQANCLRPGEMLNLTGILNTTTLGIIRYVNETLDSTNENIFMRNKVIENPTLNLSTPNTMSWSENDTCIDLDQKCLKPYYQRQVPEKHRIIPLEISFKKDLKQIWRGLIDNSSFVVDFNMSTLNHIMNGNLNQFPPNQNIIEFHKFGEVVDLFILSEFIIYKKNYIYFFSFG